MDREATTNYSVLHLTMFWMGALEQIKCREGRETIFIKSIMLMTKSSSMLLIITQLGIVGLIMTAAILIGLKRVLVMFWPTTLSVSV